MESFSSSVSTVSSFEDVLSHNMWNPLLELCRSAAFFEPFVDEIDLAEIALSCHFALDFSATRTVRMILHDDTW